MAKDKQPEPKKPLQVTPSPAKPVSTPDKPMQQARRVETEPITTLQQSQVKLDAMDAAFKKMSARGTPDAATNLTAQNDPKPMAPVARKGRVAEVQAEEAQSTASRRPATPPRESAAAFKAGAVAASERLRADARPKIGGNRELPRPISPQKQ